MSDDATPTWLDPQQSKKLRVMTPEQLAVWQKGWKQHTAQWILAEKEWERRAIMETAFWSRMSAWIGVAGAVIGGLIAILGAIAASALGLM